MSCSQFEEWAEYYQLEPWGFHLRDEHNALLAAVTHQSMGGKETIEKFRLSRAITEASETDAEKLARFFNVAPPPRR